eukprot:6449611-Alexandrium_andersonii.AAC.1
MTTSSHRRDGAGYTMRRLVQCVALSGVLRAPGDLKDAMVMAITTALPPAFAQPFLQSLSTE